MQPRDGMFLNFAALRSMSTDGWENKICIPYDRLFKKTPSNRIVRGLANSVDVENNCVVYTPIDKEGQFKAETEKITYDYLILATGSTFNMPMGFPANHFQLSSIRKDLRVLRERVKAAKKIVIIGGGAAGIELAGEISDLPNKDITVVHSGSQLFSSTANRNISKKLSDKVRNYTLHEHVSFIL